MTRCLRSTHLHQNRKISSLSASGGIFFHPSIAAAVDDRRHNNKHGRRKNDARG